MPDVRSVNQQVTIKRPPTLAALVPPGSAPAAISYPRRQAGVPACYRSDERLVCHDNACAWRGECRRLVAAWKR